MTRKLTIGILISIAVFLIGYDIVIYLEPTHDDTISEVIRDFANHPILPFALGVLCGHWLWPLTKRNVVREFRRVK